MPAKFKISFPVPREKLANVTVVVDSDTIREEDDDLTTPPQGPEEIEVSPAVLVNTVSESDAPTGQPTTLEYPDVQILPIATSTSGQPDIIYRTASTGVIFTWTEAVTGFTQGDVQVTVQSNVDMARANLCNFRGVSGSTSYTAQLNFPPSGSGLVTLTIPPNAATSVATMREGPIGYRTRQFSFDFAREPVDGVPKVKIQLPAANPYVGRTAPIRFLWNVPVTTASFTESDVTFSIVDRSTDPPTYTPTTTVTMSEPNLTSDNLLWEANLTLASVNDATEIQATVAVDSVSSQSGIVGPEEATNASFTYATPTTATSGAPTGTTLIYDTEQTVDSLDYLGSGVGGAIYGITDLTKVGNNLFGVVQVRRRRTGRTNELADSLAARAILFQLTGVETATPTNQADFTDLKKYDHILEAARSLVEHASNLYWFEGSGYIYSRGSVSNPIANSQIGNLGRYDISNNCVSLLGKVWRTALGRQRGSTFEKDYGVAGGTFSPLLSTGEKLLALPGSGNVDYVNYAVNRTYLIQQRSSAPAAPEGLTYNPDTNEIENLGDWELAHDPDDDNQLALFDNDVYLQEVEIDTRASPPRVLLVGAVERVTDEFTGTHAPYGLPTATTGDNTAAQIDNWPLVSYSNSIEPRLELVTTNQMSAWDLMLELARTTQTIISFQDELTFFKPRLPVQAVLSGNDPLAVTDTSLNFRHQDENINRPFPSAGTLVIGEEVLTYTSRGTTSLGALNRGQHNTNPVEHSSGAVVTLVDHVLTEQTFATPIEQVIIESDGVNVYNSIVVQFDGGNRMHFEKDDPSIALYGEREFVVNAQFLSRHQTEWVTWIAKHTLRTFKDLQHNIRLTLTPRFDIQVGDYLFLSVPRDEIRRIGIVTRVVYTSTSDRVELELRTVSA